MFGRGAGASFVALVFVACGGRSRFTQVEPREGVEEGTRWHAVAAAGAHTCAVAANGRLACWGANESGQIGVDCGEESLSYPVSPICSRPRWVPGIEHAVQVAGAGDGGLSGRTCALGEDGGVWCWGLDPGAHPGEFEESSRPARVGGLPGCFRIAIDRTFACAVARDGGVLCWGQNHSGVLGVPGEELAGSRTPVRIDLPAPALDVFAGRAHACALLENGQLWCWGSNDEGALGVGLRDARGRSQVGFDGMPPAGALSAVTDAAAGNTATCAVVAEGTVNCWGNKSRAKLGLPNVDAYYAERADEIEPLPTAVPGAPRALAVTLGDYHVCAVDTGRSVWCWGDNLNDQVLNGQSQLPPTRIDVGAPVQAASAGSSHTCFLTAEGRIFCSGNANQGQLGVGASDQTRGYILPIEEPVEAESDDE